MMANYSNSPNAHLPPTDKSMVQFLSLSTVGFKDALGYQF